MSSANPSRLDAVLSLVAALHLASAAAAAQELQPPIPPEVADCTFPMAKHGDPIVLPVKFLDQTGSFLLMSGASAHGFDLRYKSRLGRGTSSTLFTASRNIPVEMFQSPQLRIGTLLSQTADPVGCADLAPYGRLVGREIHGILGAPLFREKIVVLDFDRGEVQLLDRDSPPADAWGAWYPLRASARGGTPILENVTIGDLSVSCELDTGTGDAVMLDTRNFQTILNRGFLELTRESLGMGAGGPTKSRGGYLKEVTVGQFRRQHISAVEAKTNRIGLDYLSRFRVTIDVPHKKLHLAPGASYDSVDSDDRSGLHLLWIDYQVIVDAVDAGSPAARAGVVKGDVIAEFNGQRAVGSRLLSMRRELRGEVGTEIQLKTIRGDQGLAPQFRLEEYADWEAARP